MDSRRQVFWLFATLKTRGELGRVNFRKDFWDCYWRVPSNDPRNHCGTCFGSSSLLVLILLISSSVYTIDPGSDMKRLFCCTTLLLFG